MHKTILRGLTALLAFLFLAQGVRWLVAPATQAESLGMPLLDGVAASTQIGDLGAFFFAAGAYMAYALWTRKHDWLVVPASLFAAAALFRTLAWALGHAAFTAQFIVPEVVMAVVLMATLRVHREAA